MGERGEGFPRTPMGTFGVVRGNDAGNCTTGGGDTEGLGSLVIFGMRLFPSRGWGRLGGCAGKRNGEFLVGTAARFLLELKWGLCAKSRNRAGFHVLCGQRHDERPKSGRLRLRRDRDDVKQSWVGSREAGKEVHCNSTGADGEGQRPWLAVFLIGRHIRDSCSTALWLARIR